MVPLLLRVRRPHPTKTATVFRARVLVAVAHVLLQLWLLLVQQHAVVIGEEEPVVMVMLAGKQREEERRRREETSLDTTPKKLLLLFTQQREEQQQMMITIAMMTGAVFCGGWQPERETKKHVLLTPLTWADASHALAHTLAVSEIALSV